jgi:phage gp45-like
MLKIAEVDCICVKINELREVKVNAVHVTKKLAIFMEPGDILPSSQLDIFLS